jgi:hypothetical protein
MVIQFIMVDVYGEGDTFTRARPRAGISGQGSGVRVGSGLSLYVCIYKYMYGMSMMDDVYDGWDVCVCLCGICGICRSRWV